MSPRAPAAPIPDSTRPALTGPALAGIRRLSAIDTVRARIAMAVELQLLRPGDGLPPPAEIARALAVSEITVKRGLTQLAREGVLERRRGRNGGTLVAQSPQLGRVSETAAYRDAASEVHDVIDRRLLLECGVAHLAALSATKKQVAALRDFATRMDHTETWADFHGLDEQFHLLLAEATRLPPAKAQYEIVLRELYDYYLPYPMAYLRKSNREHHDLIDAIASRDPAAAVDVARRHVSTLHKSMFVGLSKAPVA